MENILYQISRVGSYIIIRVIHPTVVCILLYSTRDQLCGTIRYTVIDIITKHRIHQMIRLSIVIIILIICFNLYQPVD